MMNVCAREVILGLPAKSVKHIEFLNDDIAQILTELLPAVIQVPRLYKQYNHSSTQISKSFSS